ncbi:MAG: translocation/assembly module TamB domain-containing protein, partial [Paracoccaceae bacterium]
RPLVAAGLGFSGVYTDERLAGRLNGVANLESFPVQFSSDLAFGDAGRTVSNLVFRTAGTVLTGELRQDGDGLIEGRVDYDASDISTAAALLLQDAAGAIRGHVSFARAGGRQSLEAVADVRNLAFRTIKLADGRVRAKLRDAYGVPKISGTVAARKARIAGVSVDDFTALAVNQGGATLFRANAVLQNGTRMHAEGMLDEEDSGFRVDLTALDLSQETLSAGLSYPALIRYSKGEVRIETLAVKMGDGEIRASGVVSDMYGLAITLDAVPLSLANALRPDLGLEGTVSGNGAMYGLRSAPNVFLDLRGRGLNSSVLREAGLAAFDLDALVASNQNDGIDVNARLTSPDGVTAAVTGEIPFGGADMALDVELEKFPLAFIDRRIGNRGLRGQVTGRSHIAGTLRHPSVTFELGAEGVTLREVRIAELAPLKADVKGRYFGKSLQIESGRVTGPGGLAVDMSGFVAAPSGRLDIKIDGLVPLSAIIPIYFRRGLNAEGLAKADLTVRGRFDSTRLSGSLATSGAVITDPPTNMRVEKIAMRLRLQDNRVSIVEARGQFAGGGRIGITGGMDFDIPAGLPADLQISLSDVIYSNRRFLTSRFDAALALKGPLARGPLLSGDVTLKETELSIAGRFGQEADLLQVTHRHAPRNVQTTESLVRKVAREGAAHKARYPVQLDLTITSKNRVFVRGRGVDAELGGKLKVGGPIDDYIPQGGFRLIRGRLNILAQRITLDEGQVTLLGDLDPELLFLANMSAGGLSATIRLSGRVSDPVLGITSSPELPEDEIIARLVFERSVGELSPIQLARVASVISELTGGADRSIFGGLRQATGLDDFDISSDQQGNTVVKAGKYVDDSVYLGVEADTEGSSRATINLDITDNVRARGSMGSDGESSIGLFFERDY